MTEDDGKKVRYVLFSEISEGMKREELLGLIGVGELPEAEERFMHEFVGKEIPERKGDLLLAVRNRDVIGFTKFRGFEKGGEKWLFLDRIFVKPGLRVSKTGEEVPLSNKLWYRLEGEALKRGCVGIKAKLSEKAYSLVSRLRPRTGVKITAGGKRVSGVVDYRIERVPGEEHASRKQAPIGYRPMDARFGKRGKR